MLTTERPYFFNNKEWYEIDEDRDIIILTDKAPKDDICIKNSYRDYLKTYVLSKQLLGGIEQFDFDVDDDKQFDKFINKLFDGKIKL